jgi:flagellar assembly factor FliW
MPAVADNHLVFPEGIPGFPRLTRFALVDAVEDGAFQMLQSLEEPEVGMIVCSPWLFFPDYSFDLPDSDREALELETTEEALVLAPVTLDAEHGRFHLNLMGPLVLNQRTRRGRQLVLADSGHPLRATVELAGQS